LLSLFLKNGSAAPDSSGIYLYDAKRPAEFVISCFPRASERALGVSEVCLKLGLPLLCPNCVGSVALMQLCVPGQVRLLLCFHLPLICLFL
jgi:hypothetical protein